MRIIAGKLRHRNIMMTGLPTTRETQDKVRGAIFNMIGPYFDGGKALDLFAGSGAMAIEAYSRGIAEIYLNDINGDALAICKKNCASLGIKNAHFANLDYVNYLKLLDVKMDLIFLDPPYALNDIEDILTVTLPHLKQGGLIVFEMAKDSNYPTDFLNLSLLKNRTYGIKRVIVYQKEE